MDHSQFSRWGRMALPAAALWIAGCGAQSAPTAEESYADSPGLVRLASPADLVSPLNETPTYRTATQFQRGASPADSETALAHAGDTHVPAALDPGASRTPTAPLRESLPERPPSFDLSTIDEPGSTSPAPSAQAPITAATPPAAANRDLSAVENPAAEEVAAAEPGRSVLVAAAPGDNEQRGVLPWSRGRSNSREMQVVSARSMQLCRDGLRLAERGAIYSARAKFIEALRAVARALDVEQQTALYTKALTAGMTALKESSDFTPRSGATQEIDVRHAIISHRTPVLKHNEGGLPSATLAVQRYYTYAQEQLAAAAGQDPAGSFALYCLGRISLAPEQTALNAQEKASQAVVFHQSALLVDPANFVAANEAAVLLADAGRLEQARTLLLQSLSVAPQAAVWQNLAIVHTRLGENDLAAQARSKAASLAHPAPVTSTGPVTWVDPATFARIKSASDGLQLPLTASKPAVQAPAVPQAAPAKPSVSAWLPWTKSTTR